MSDAAASSRIAAARGSMIEKYSLRRPLNWFASTARSASATSVRSRRSSSCCRRFSTSTGAAGRTSASPACSPMRGRCASTNLLARALHARGWLQFSVVEFDGAPIAFHFGFDYGGCVTWYKPSFEVRYAEHSPGLLLTRQLIEDCLQRVAPRARFHDRRRGVQGTLREPPALQRVSRRLSRPRGYGIAIGDPPRCAVRRARRCVRCADARPRSRCAAAATAPRTSPERRPA